MKTLLLSVIVGFCANAWAQVPFCEDDWGVLVSSGPVRAEASSVELVRDVPRTQAIYKELVLNQGQITSLERKLFLLGVYTPQGTVLGALAKDLQSGKRVLLVIKLGSAYLDGRLPTFSLCSPKKTSGTMNSVSIGCGDFKLEEMGGRQSMNITGHGRYYIVLTNPDERLSWNGKSVELKLPGTADTEPLTLYFPPRK